MNQKKPAKIGIIANTAYSEDIRPFFGEFLHWLNSEHIDFCVEREFADLAEYPYGKPISDLLNESDMIVVLGGDGTILRASHLVGDRGTPIVGIRFGRLGFLAELSEKTFSTELKAILNGKYKLDERMVLSVHISTENKIFHALNDVVIYRGHSSKLTTIHVNIDGSYMNTFRADGIIVATPTGSTAYSLSCGGPILVPGLDGMVISPICPHMLSNRPTVVHGDSRIEMIFDDVADGCRLSVDGRQDMAVNEKTVVKIDKASCTARLVRAENSSFFSVVRNKLKWTQ